MKCSSDPACVWPVYDLGMCLWHLQMFEVKEPKPLLTPEEMRDAYPNAPEDEPRVYERGTHLQRRSTSYRHLFCKPGHRRKQ